MKPIEEWTDKEIADKVDEHWKIAFATDGKGLTKEMKDLDKKLKDEYWKREKAGKHEIPCMICTDNTVSYYDIMKQFCSDMSKINKNICEKHMDTLRIKCQEFIVKTAEINSKAVEACKNDESHTEKLKQ